jgi:flagellar protein FliJ
MHAPDTRTLTVLLEREEAARDAALLALQQAESQLTQARAQAEALAAYRHETVARWQAQMKAASGIEVVHGYRTFMQRLDQALAQQAGVVERAEAAVSARLEARLAAETRVAAIGKLIGRRVQEHRHAEHRRDQRQTDEAAQRTSWAAAAATGGHGPLS